MQHYLRIPSSAYSDQAKFLEKAKAILERQGFLHAPPMLLDNNEHNFIGIYIVQVESIPEATSLSITLGFAGEAIFRFMSPHDEVAKSGRDMLLKELTK